MKIFFLLSGSRGDIQPYAALALGFQARGHQVRVCGPQNFSLWAQSLGLDYAGLPFDTQALLADDKLRGQIRGDNIIGFFNRVNRLLQPQAQAIWSAALEALEGFDLIIPATTTEFLAVGLAERSGARLVFTELTPVAPSRHYAPMAFRTASLGPLNAPAHALSHAVWWRMNRGFVNSTRRQLGLPELGGNPVLKALRGGAPLLHGFSPLIFPAPPDWKAPQHAVTGAWRLPEAAAQGMVGDHQDPGFRAWLEEGAPPVFLSFGSMPLMEGENLLELAGDLAESLGIRVLVGAGWTNVDVQACDLPEDVAVVGDCDHRWLFPQCSVIVHHGGAGTTHSASHSGVPQVICPVFADQPFWAGRVRGLGAGVVLPAKKLTFERLQDAVQAALEEGIQAGASNLGAALQNEDGVAAACEAVERWALASPPATGPK
jgi:sterol 3beta-glucosyltransferase